MKRLTAWILLMLMLSIGFATADEKEYAWIIPNDQSDYPYPYGDPVITRETYPVVRLASSPRMNTYLVFDPPTQSVLNEFGYWYAEYTCVGEGEYDRITIRYTLSSNYSSPDDFRGKESSKTVMTSTDTTTSFIDQWGDARGYIALPEYGENLSLALQVSDIGNEARKKKVLVDEMVRLQKPSAIHLEEVSPYWSYGLFSGAKLTNVYDQNYTVKFDFPSLAEVGPYGEWTDFIITRLDARRMEGYYLLENGQWLDISIYTNNSEAKPNSSMPSFEFQTENSTWYASVFYNSDKKGSEIYRGFYLSRNLPKTVKGDNVNVEFSLVNSTPDAVEWNKDMIIGLANMLDSKISVINASQNPYVSTAAEEALRAEEEAARAAEEAAKAGEEAAKAAEEAVKAEEGWTCPACNHEGNSGNFCTNCGSPRPVMETKWTCPSCGREDNDGNFCSNCGTKRPDPVWTCPECGREGNDGNFCPICGTKLP